MAIPSPLEMLFASQAPSKTCTASAETTRSYNYATKPSDATLVVLGSTAEEQRV